MHKTLLNMGNDLFLKYIFLPLLNKKMNDNLHPSLAFSLKKLLKQHNLQSLIDTHANKV